MQAHTRSDLIHHFGRFGDVLYDFCRGHDDRDVETEHERKSLGTEETFSKDLTNFEEMKTHVIRMSQEIKESLEKYEDKIVKNLHVKIKYQDFKQTTIERQLPVSEESFLQLFEERWTQDARPVRLIGVGVKFESEDSIATTFSQLKLNL